MFKFEANHSIDFGYAMFRLVNNKKLSQADSDKEFLNNGDIEDTIKEIEEKLSLAQFKKMNELVNKYFLHSFMVKISCLNPGFTEEEVIQHIKNLNSHSFYMNYLTYVLSVSEDVESGIKDSINRLNNNNPMKEAPSYTAVKYLKSHSNELRNELILFLEYFLPIYLEAKKKINYHTDKALAIFKDKFQSFEEFLETYQIINKTMVPDIDETYGFTTVFADTCMYMLIDNKICHIILGTSIIKTFTDEYKERQKTQFFKCLGDPTKLKILELIKGDRLCSADLVEKLELTKSTISHHITQMLSVNLLYLAEKEGRRVYYTINTDHIETMFQEMLKDLKD